MTQHTLTIPLLTLQIGSRTFGPAAIGANNSAVLSIDRTVVNGLNSLASASTLDLVIQTSSDGTTFFDEVEATFVGGIISNHHGQINTQSLSVSGVDPSRVSVRVVAVVSGTPIAIAGSVVIT